MLPDSAVTDGSLFDFWDTVEDRFGLAPTRVTDWSANAPCDSSHCTDVTTTDGGTSFTTCETSSTCIYRDELSGLRVTGILSSGTMTNTNSPMTYSWSGSINLCFSSQYGGHFAGNWRVPQRATNPAPLMSSRPLAGAKGTCCNGFGGRVCSHLFFSR